MDPGIDKPPSLWLQAFNALPADDQKELHFAHNNRKLHPSDIIAEVEGKKQECVDRQWTLYTNKAGEKVPVRDVLTKVVDWLDKFKEVGDMAVQLAPGYASIPWIAVRALLQMTVDDCDTFGAMLESIERVSGIIARYTELEANVLIRTSNLTNQLSAALVRLYQSALKFLARAHRYYKHGSFRRALKSAITTAKASVEEPMLRIDKHEDEVYKLVRLVQDELTGARLDAIMAGIRQSVEMSQRSNEERRSKLAAWINGIDTKNTYETALQYHHAGTCEWALQLPEFHAWKDDAPDPKLLWIHGPPGFGKTFLSAWIVQTLEQEKQHLEQEEQAPLSYFFCVADNQLTRDPYAILRSWLTQMLEQDSAVVDSMDRVYKVRNKEQNLTHLGLWEIFGAIRSGGTFVLDGFDECTDIDAGAHYHRNDARNLFLRDLLKNLANTKFRVLVVSRDVPDIREYLGHDSSVDGAGVERLEYGITAEDTAGDVQSYSEHLINAKLSRKKEELRQEIATQAAQRSEGMFLWIKLLEQKISPAQNAKQLARTVTEMPSGISEAYSHELERIGRMEPEEKEKAVTILRWVLFAVRPLQVKQLAEALVVSDDELNEYPEDELPDCWHESFVDEDYVKEMILGRCGSLVQLRSNAPETPLADYTVHFVHFSVKEYLSTLFGSHGRERLAVDLGMLDAASEERRLSGICLRYLTLNMFEEIPPDIEIYPFLSYAAWAWYMNSFQGKPAPPQDIIHRTQRAFDPSISSWMVWTPLLEAELTDWYRIDLIPDVVDDIDSVATDSVTEPTASETSETSETDEGRQPLEASDSSETDKGRQPPEASDSSETPEPSDKGLPPQALTPMYYACLLGLTDVVRWLEDQGLDCGLAGGRYGFPLQAAAVGGHEELVKHMLNRGVDVSQQGGYYGAAIVAAAAVSSLDIVDMLLISGADTEATDDSGLSALHHAAKRGSVDIVERLLNHGADINAVAESSTTAAYLACMWGHTDVVALLADRGADLTVFDNTAAGGTLLQTAISNADIDMVTTLLNKGVSPNEFIPDGGRYAECTPLQTAIVCNQLEIARLLVRNDANVDQATNRGLTPLLLAVMTGNLDVIEWLLDAGASMQCTWESSQQSLFDFAADEMAPRVAELLVMRGCFRMQSRADHVQERVSPDTARDGNGVVLAAYNGDVEGVGSWAAGNGPPLSSDALDEALGEALHASSAAGHLEVVDLLLCHGAPVNARDINGRTALHHATRHHHYHVADLLVEHGADISLEDAIGSTPIDLAVVHGQRSASFIRKHMDNFTLNISRQPSLLQTPNQATDLTVMGTRKFISGSWTGHYEYLSWQKGQKDEFAIDIPTEPPKDSRPCTFSSESKDVVGPFQIHGFVDPAGTVWFVKLYNRFGWLYRGHVDLNAGVIKGTWGTNRKLWFGTFEMRWE